MIESWPSGSARPAGTSGPALAGMRPLFRLLTVTVVPEAARLEAAAWTEMEAIVDRTLATRPASLKAQLRSLLQAIEWLAVLRYGRRFSRLPAERRAQWLATLQDAPLRLLRRGMWGLRTLALMGYYGRADAAREIGGRASYAGWAARR